MSSKSGCLGVLDRLLAPMEELGMIEKVATPAEVFIPYFDKTRLHDYLKLAAAVRAAGIGVDVYPEPKKLGQQLKYADRRGHRIALIAGETEFESGTCQVKDLQTATNGTAACCYCTYVEAVTSRAAWDGAAWGREV